MIPYQQSQHTSFALPTSVAQPPSHEKEGHIYEQTCITVAATTSKEALLLEQKLLPPRCRKLGPALFSKAP